MKSRFKKIAFITFVAVLLVGCGKSNEQIGETVRVSMQQKLDSDAQLKEWHLTVRNIQVLKQGDYQFKGIATVLHEGAPHEVPIDIAVDGSSVMWQAQPGAFMFVALEALKKPLQQQYVVPDKQFLNSELMVRAGIHEVYLSVEQFEELLQKAEMDNGKTPEIQGWTRDGNIYSLHVKMKMPLELKFTHILNAPANGAYSVMSPIEHDGEEIQPMQFVSLVNSMATKGMQQRDGDNKLVNPPHQSQEVTQPNAIANTSSKE